MKSSPKLATERQIEVLKFIIKYKEEKKMSPSVRDVADYFKITVTGANDNIKALIKKGYLSSTPYISRSIVIEKMPEGEE